MHSTERAFGKIGARVKFAELRSRQISRWRRLDSDFALDVRRDARGEFFLISQIAGSGTEFIVLDAQPRDRHLLLLSRKGSEKHRFLLGHDERHWFVASIPEATPVSRVADAKEALKPESVLESERNIRSKDRNRRANRARVRQGEWFFLPVPELTVPKLLILRDEFLRRGGGNAHVCEELFRLGGETVYVSPRDPNGLTEEQFRDLPERERKRWNWRLMRRDPKVFVRGRISHVDHRTVILDGWHQVFSNTENRAAAMQNVAFLD